MFCFKDIKSENMSIVVEKMPPLEPFPLKGSSEEVEGRNGSLYIEDNSYGNLTKSIEGHYIGNNVEALCSWLSGKGNLVLDSFPDRYYKARVSSKISFSEIIKFGLSKVLIQFDCDPFGYLFSGDSKLIYTSSNINLINPGTIYSQPILKLYATGDVNITINGRLLKISNVSEYIVIDSILEIAYKNKEMNQNSKLCGEYPIFDEGRNLISIEGAFSRLEIIPKWRCLM